MDHSDDVAIAFRRGGRTRHEDRLARHSARVEHALGAPAGFEVDVGEGVELQRVLVADIRHIPAVAIGPAGPSALGKTGALGYSITSHWIVSPSSQAFIGWKT